MFLTNGALVVDKSLINTLAVAELYPLKEAFLRNSLTRECFPLRWWLESGILEVVFKLKCSEVEALKWLLKFSSEAGRVMFIT